MYKATVKRRKGVRALITITLPKEHPMVHYHISQWRELVATIVTTDYNVTTEQLTVVTECCNVSDDAAVAKTIETTAEQFRQSTVATIFNEYFMDLCKKSKSGLDSENFFLAREFLAKSLNMECPEFNGSYYDWAMCGGSYLSKIRVHMMAVALGEAVDLSVFQLK